MILVLSAALAPVLAQTNSVSGVLDRTAAYVSRYEVELGNLLVSESYLQTAVIYNFQGNGVTHTDRRQTQSDFLMLVLDPERIGLRLVNRVDGKPVDRTQQTFETLLGGSSASAEALRKQINAIREESSRYNIGAVKREINVPTSALKVVRKTEAPRFSFNKREEKKLNGVNTWEIKFQEERGPTLSRGLNGEPLMSYGSLWIEPETGRILKTEIRVENPYSNPKAKAMVAVTYKENKSLGMLVPSRMEEEYKTELTTIDAVADYSDYRFFKVDVKSSIPSRP